MERSSRIILGLVAIAGAAIGYQRYQARQLSPFRMWDIRTGVRFSKMDDDADREMHRRFECRAIEGSVRLCEARTTVPGVMRLAVDPSGRVMIIQWRVADSSLRMTEAARKMAAEWTLVEPRHARTAGPGERGLTRWVTRESAWSASMSDLTDPRRTRSIELVDERRLRTVASASAPALLQLAQAGYLDHDALSAAFARAPDALAAAAVTLGTPGRNLAATAAALPACGYQGGDSVTAGDEMRTSYGNDQLLVEQAISGAFPGMHAVFGKRVYLVNAIGAAEEIRVLLPMTNGDAYAVAVTFPRRVEAVDRLLREFAGGAADCRAPAVIIAGHRDRADGRLLDLTVVDADEESLAGGIGALDPIPAVTTSPSFAIHYTASYGTRNWIGEVDWDALVEVGPDGPRIVRRLPGVLGWKDIDDHEVAGIAVVEKESAAGMQLAIVRATDETPTPLFVANGPRGLPSGWMLLDLLQQSSGGSLTTSF